MKPKEIELVQFKEMMQEIYEIGQEAESIKTEEILSEIKKKLNLIFNDN